ncbi:hypothetical protein CVD25_22340 [Bacillus canaveralius]|uniref:Uncharacterized protein n=1 Tax=Bacillus canaveralius TaxID=1403243 RepID=A0A2N5GIU3_9BACI|nr:hypothetical protein CU635_16490 [Bacillus canaveralius]PLR88580.1 hypothetical protein CVD25_22340 [Bacillus canaveralius]
MIGVFISSKYKNKKSEVLNELFNCFSKHDDRTVNATKMLVKNRFWKKDKTLDEKIVLINVAKSRF